MRPEALAMALSHVPGSGPVSLERVAAGEVNETWRVARGGTEYALRLAVPGAADLGLDRHWECRVLRAAAAAGLAPALERCAPDAGVLVMRWRHGARWTCKEAQDPQRLERMADLVRRIQTCSPAPPLRSMSVEDWLVHYGDRLDARGAALSRHPLLRAQGATLAAQRLARGPACVRARAMSWGSASRQPDRRRRRPPADRLGICSSRRSAVGSGGVVLEQRSCPGAGPPALTCLPGPHAGRAQRGAPQDPAMDVRVHVPAVGSADRGE